MTDKDKPQEAVAIMETVLKCHKMNHGALCFACRERMKAYVKANKKPQWHDLTIEEVRKWLYTDEKLWFWNTPKDAIIFKRSLWGFWESAVSPFKPFCGTWYTHCSKIHPITGKEA